ncbi:MAG: ferritin [Deinococcus sp.]|nr:ferritin [Deinococcus sp.]
MISAELAKSLNEQVGHELTASQQYLAIAVYFAQQNLDGWAGLFYRQSEEEREHALKIVRFLVDAGVKFDIPATAKAAPSFKSAADAVKKAHQWELQVTQQFQEMARIATEKRDYTGFQFLQWFIEEQVEEVTTMEKLLALLESGINLFQAEALLPKE